MNVSVDARDATPDILACVCSHRRWIRNPKPLRCRLRVGLQWILPRPERKSRLCCTRHMTFRRSWEKEMKEADGGWTAQIKEMAASSLKPKLTRQVSAPPEETSHEGRAAQIAAVCSVESFSDRWGKRWMLASLLHDSFLVIVRVLACSLTSRWDFLHLFSSFLYFAIAPKIKAPSPDTPFPSWLLHPAFSSTSVESGVQTKPLFSLSRPWHLVPSQISRSEISKRKLMWTLSHFNICEDVASNLPLTHAQH